MKTLFHAFNWQFSEIEKKLPQIAKLGFHGIQISPAQQCLSEANDWFLRYQPFDYSSISGLGSANDLESLCTAAKHFQIFIIADLVFNHMAGV